MLPIEIKRGVKTVGLTPQLMLGLVTAAAVYSQMGATEFVVTSITDGKHKRQSAHYSGRAADLRIWTLVNDFDWSDEKKQEAAAKAVSAAAEISSLLGDDYDCIAEGDHIHLEWDPKG